MIHIAGTLCIRTAEGFLKPEEIERLSLVMDDALGSRGRTGTGPAPWLHRPPRGPGP